MLINIKQIDFDSYERIYAYCRKSVVIYDCIVRRSDYIRCYSRPYLNNFIHFSCDNDFSNVILENNFYLQMYRNSNCDLISKITRIIPNAADLDLTGPTIQLEGVDWDFDFNNPDFKSLSDQISKYIIYI